MTGEEKMTTVTQLGMFSGRLLYQLSYRARSNSNQITKPLSPSPAERMKERKKELNYANDTCFHAESTDVPGAQPSGVPQH